MKEIFFRIIDGIGKLIGTISTKAFVGLGILAVFCFQAYALVYVEIPKENKDILIHYMAIVDTTFGFVVGYYFGSSQSSSKKDATIEKVINKTP